MLVTLKPYDWTVTDNEDERLEIRCWGHSPTSEPILVRINTYPATCYVELPTFVGNHHVRWTTDNIDKLVNSINYRLGEDKPAGYQFVMKQKLYYYRSLDGQPKKYPMLYLKFRTLSALQKFDRLCNYPVKVFDLGSVTLKCYEAKVSPVRKLLSLQNCGYSEWLRVEAEPVDDPISTLKAEYLADWSTLTSVPADECRGWMIHPTVLSFDIETYSDNHRAFPNRHHPQHVVNIISCVTQRAGKPETRERTCLVVGDCPAEGTKDGKIINVKTEMELLEALKSLIRNYDPDILIGYNIFGYDYPYLDVRLRRKMGEWGDIGRLRDKKCVLDTKTWESKGYKTNSIANLQMEGRISIDLLPLVRRDYKLKMYTLEVVSQHFLGRGKHPVKPVDMFKAYEGILATKKLAPDDPARQEAELEYRRIIDYCLEDSDLVMDLFDHLNTFIGLSELSNIVGITIYELYTRGQQVRCYSQLYDLSSRKGFVIDSIPEETIGFTGGFVFEPTPGLFDNIICLDFASLYPSIIEESNICYTTLVPPELMDAVPDEMCHVFQFEDVIEEEEDEEEESIVDILMGKTKKKAKVEPKKMAFHYKFLKAEHCKGLLPELVHHLVSERRKVRDEMGTTKDPMLKVILNARQLALKVSANSFFGFLGVTKGGKLPLLPGARCITCRGRQLINLVNDWLKKNHNAKIVYNDTDSSMADIGITDPAECNSKGRWLAEQVSKIFPPPLRMEYEKGMRLLCIKKKCYASALVSDDGSIKLEKIYEDMKAGKSVNITEKILLVRGIILARRDNNQWVRDVYQELLIRILCRQDIRGSLDCIVNHVRRLVTGEVPFEKLSTVKALGSNYKNENYFMKVFGDYLNRVGKPAMAGDRLEYIVIDNPLEPTVGKRMRLLESYAEDTGGEKLDYAYYLKAMARPVEQLWQIGYATVLNERYDLGYKPKTQHHWVGIHHPIKMMIRMLHDGVDLGTVMEMWDGYIKKEVVFRFKMVDPNTFGVKA